MSATKKEKYDIYGLMQHIFVQNGTCGSQSTFAVLTHEFYSKLDNK